MKKAISYLFNMKFNSNHIIRVFNKLKRWNGTGRISDACFILPKIIDTVKKRYLIIDFLIRLAYWEYWQFSRLMAPWIRHYFDIAFYPSFWWTWFDNSWYLTVSKEMSQMETHTRKSFLKGMIFVDPNDIYLNGNLFQFPTFYLGHHFLVKNNL